MPIATGVVAIHLPAARGALRALPSTRRGPTRHQIAQRARLAREQTRPEVRTHGGPVAADDLRHLQHGALARSAEAVDEVRERIGEGGADLLGQMRVDLRRPGTTVAEDLLNDPQVHPGFQQMRGEGMSQRILTLPMNRLQPSFTTDTILSTANT